MAQVRVPWTCHCGPRFREIAVVLDRGAGKARLSAPRSCFRRSALSRLDTPGAVPIFAEHGSSGVLLTPVDITAERAGLEVRTIVRNPGANPVAVTVRHTVTEPRSRRGRSQP